jgi:hypothetical protein
MRPQSLKRQPEEEIERHIEALIAHLKTLDVAGRQAIIARILHETLSPRILIFIRAHHSLQAQPQQRGGGRELFLARGGRHTFPWRSGRIPLIAVAGHAGDIEEAPRRAEAVSLAHGRGASI